MDLSKQYNLVGDTFSKIDKEANQWNRELFYSYLGFVKPGMKLLDIGCGYGLDLAHYKELGASLSGLDASENFVLIAKNNFPDADIRVGLFEKNPFPDNSFDVVLSKYALQTSNNIAPIISEIHRVLKPGGTMMYLVTHPFRQYFEKKNTKADYFKQEVVESNIFDGKVTVKEPTHTMGEYLSSFLFEKFDVQLFDEQWELAAEQIDGRKYPGFFILKAKKK